MLHAGKLASLGTVIGFIGDPVVVGAGFLATQATARARPAAWIPLLAHRRFIFGSILISGLSGRMGVAKIDGVSLRVRCRLGQGS